MTNRINNLNVVIIPRPLTSPSLHHLPDDILLRIISLTGRPGTQVSVAYTLAAICTRLRRLLKTQFLTSITNLSPDYISELSLSDPESARMALTSMFTCTTALRTVTLSGCSPALLSNNALTALAVSSRLSLTMVNLAFCRINDSLIVPLLQCPNLRTLILCSCDGITGSMFQQPSIMAPLELLDLSWVHSLSYPGVCSIAKVTTLKQLILKGCPSVNFKALQALTSSDIKYSLNSICVAHCPLRDNALLHLLENAPNLTKLSVAEDTGNIWAANNFTAHGIAELRILFPDVEIQFST